jgi:hypothetical protein
MVMKNKKLSQYLGGHHELPYIRKIEDDDIEKEDDNAAATEEIEEERVAEEVNDAAKDGEVKTNYPR